VYCIREFADYDNLRGSDIDNSLERMTMLHFEGDKKARACDGVSRRDFLRVGALGAGPVLAGGLSLADLAAGERQKDVNCILLFLVGGPSQLETWDVKPGAPSEVRGPFRPIPTSVPGMSICEHFPRMARLARHYAIVRSVHHDQAPVHETGQQLLQTGRLNAGGQEYPHYGAAVSYLRGPRDRGMPASVVLPSAIGNTGVGVGHGQTAGGLGQAHEPFVLRVDPADLTGSRGLHAAVDQAHRNHDENHQSAAFDRLFSPGAKQAFDISLESADVRSRYGWNTFGQSCLMARRLVEQGVRVVTVNMFETVFNEVTWDCHADHGALATTLDDYARTLCPMFDLAYSALLEDLYQRGLLDDTLVLATGEFGRTPHLNPRGGRDHWPGCWSVLFAGAGVRGGQVIGSSDRLAAEPKDRPVTPQEIAATVYHTLGVDPGTRVPESTGEMIPLVEARPIVEMF
jgi:uncharacterized protein (DUF1501 family)